MLEEITGLLEAPLVIWEAIIRIGLSLVASVVAYWIYQIFYGSKHIGAGVNRTFLIGGPAITMLFLVIQTSIPLGVGLLGALSFVRFRTPIKDPAEIGFLLLLIAASIGAATGNLIAVAILYAIVFITLFIQRLASNKITLFGRGHLMIYVESAAYPGIEKKLTAYLEGHLNGLSLDTMSTLDGRVGINYQYRRQKSFDWGGFINDLNQMAGPIKVEVFID